jgi:hypothetical protein
VTLTAVASDEPDEPHFVCPSCNAEITPPVVNNVTIQVGAPGGSLNLTTAQTRQLVEQIQAALLRQAQRNRKPDGGAPGA